MTTDFSYGGKQIVTSGPFKPSGKNTPVDATQWAYYIIEDKNIYYVITSFKVGKKKYKPYELEIGVFDNNSSIDYIKDEIKKCAFLLKIVPKNELLRRFKIKKRLKFLKKFYEK